MWVGMIGVVVLVVYQLPSLMKIHLCDSKFYLTYIYPCLPTFFPTHEGNTPWPWTNPRISLGLNNVGNLSVHIFVENTTLQNIDINILPIAMVIFRLLMHYIFKSRIKQTWQQLCCSRPWNESICCCYSTSHNFCLNTVGFCTADTHILNSHP